MEAANKDPSEIIGDADFDLGYYANNPEVTRDKLPLKNSKIDPKAYIEIEISTNAE